MILSVLGNEFKLVIFQLVKI